jgi:hypothetical protein
MVSMCIVFITAKAREGYRPLRHDGAPPRMVGTSKSILILAPLLPSPSHRLSRFPQNQLAFPPTPRDEGDDREQFAAKQKSTSTNRTDSEHTSKPELEAATIKGKRAPPKRPQSASDLRLQVTHLGQLESMTGSPETFRSLERKSCKTNAEYRITPSRLLRRQAGATLIGASICRHSALSSGAGMTPSQPIAVFFE